MSSFIDIFYLPLNILTEQNQKEGIISGCIKQANNLQLRW